MQTLRETETEAGPRTREENLSKDGKWRSFPKVPHLLQYITNGNYYGRIKVGGKLIREDLHSVNRVSSPTGQISTSQDYARTSGIFINTLLSIVDVVNKLRSQTVA
jgi:hypothetical protein